MGMLDPKNFICSNDGDVSKSIFFVVLFLLVELHLRKLSSLMRQPFQHLSMRTTYAFCCNDMNLEYLCSPAARKLITKYTGRYANNFVQEPGLRWRGLKF